MIAEVSAKHKTADTFLHVAKTITGRSEAKKQNTSALSPLLAKLRGLKK